MVARDIFSRLSAGRPQQTEATGKQPHHRREDPKIFLRDILAGGPVPANLVIARGAERGFSKRQITYARERLQLVALKGPGRGAGWYWILPFDNRGIPARAGGPGISRSLNQ